MKKNMKKIFKSAAFFVALFSFSIAQVLPVYSISIPSSGEIMDDIEKRYGFDGNTLRRAERKTNYPKADVFFNNNTPKEGEKVTATANPSGFKNDRENLYYTWFLVREGDDLNDGDAMEKAKRRAMGIVARGDFDPFLFGSDYSNGDEDAPGAYFAPFGGADGVGGKPGTDFKIGQFEESCYSDADRRTVDPSCISRCYKHNFGINNPTGNDKYQQSSSGKDLIVECEHHFPDAPEGDSFENPATGEEIECEDDYEIGDGEFTVNEKACWRLDPENPDTDGDGTPDEADLAGKGQKQFTWNYQKGDRVGVLVEGTSMIPTNEDKEGSFTKYKTENQSFNVEQDSWADSESSASVSDGNSSASSSDSSSSGASQSINFETNQTFNDGFTENKEAGLNSYYKITWAGTGICTDEPDYDGEPKDDFMKNDWCDNESQDLGYTYLASKPVYEETEGQLDTILDFKPSKPQADTGNESFTSLIEMESSIESENVDEDFVYYDWDVYYCQEDNLETCTEDASTGENEAEWLTENCGEGDVTQDCAPDLISNSYIEGLGLNEFNFKPTQDFLESKNLSDEKFYFKVFLRTKKSQTSNIVSVSGADVPVVLNNTNIRFYDVIQGPDGLYEKGEEICKDGLYSKLCPVYPFQLVAAEADFEEDIQGHIWEIDGRKANAPLNSSDCIFEGGCSFGETLFFPVIGGDKDISKISLKAEKEEGKDISSDRSLSVSEPLPIIKSDDTSKVWPKVIDDGSEDGGVSENVFLGSAGEKAEIRADFVPSYLSEGEIDLTWYLNGAEVNEEFISNNEELEILLEGKKMNFKIPEKPGNNLGVKVEIEKVFDSSFKEDLKATWGIEPNQVKDLFQEDSITLRITNDSNPEDEVAREGSLGFFLASTYKNAPEYTIFLLKLSVLAVLFWFVLYGVYFFEDEESRKRLFENLKKEK
jgi:hypothetical protein